MHPERKTGRMFMWIFFVLGALMVILSVLLWATSGPMDRGVGLLGWILCGAAFGAVGLAANAIGEERALADDLRIRLMRREPW